MMDEPIYTLHAGSQTYRGTAKELEAIRVKLKREAHESWVKWGDIGTPSPCTSESTYPESSGDCGTISHGNPSR